MGPKKKLLSTDETPPDSPGAEYDKVILICLKEEKPVLWMPADHVYADQQTFQQVSGFNPKAKLTLQHRAKVVNLLFDETENPRGMSVFCRVEKGTDHGRITDLVDKLNARFKSLTYPQKSGLKAGLLKNWGEKMMRDWTYDERDPITNRVRYYRWKEVTTRQRGAEHLPQTTTGGEDSDEDFQSSQSKSDKRRLSTSSKGSSSRSIIDPRASGIFLQNPFFTSKPGTSKGAEKTSKKAPPSQKAVDKPDDKKKRTRKASEFESPSKRLCAEPSTSSSARRQLSFNPDSESNPSNQSTPTPAVEYRYQGEAYNLDVPKVIGQYTEAVVISDEQLDRKLEDFLTRYERNPNRTKEMKALIKEAVTEVVEEVIDVRFISLKEGLQKLIESNTAKVLEVLATKATKSSTSRILEAINSTKTTIEDFSIEQVRIRNEIGNIAENTAEKESRACGILGRFLPFDLMGQGFDFFMSSHYVQSKVVSLIKDEFNDKKGSVDVRIAFAFTNVFLTRVALAHLVWRHPKNPSKILYYKRTVPESVQKIISKDIIPYAREKLELGNEVFAGSFKGVKKVMATRFANARTKQLEIAFGSSCTPDVGLDALHNLDNEYYVHNVHAIPSTATMDDREEYKEKLMSSRAECSNAFRNYEDKEALGKSFMEEDDLFDTLRGFKFSNKIYSSYEVMQGIIAAAKADGLDVTKLTFDQPKNLPSVKDVYKKVLDDHIADLDGLLNKFPVDTNIRIARSESEDEEEKAEIQMIRASDSGESSDDDDEDAASKDFGAEEDDGEDCRGKSADDEESPSELEKNIQVVQLDDDDEDGGICHTQQPFQPERSCSQIQMASDSSRPPPVPARSSSQLPMGSKGHQTSQAPLTRGSLSRMQTRSEVQSRATPPLSASQTAPSTSSTQQGPFSPGGTPRPLPPLPKDPYALPDPFANLTNEELEARVIAAQQRLARKNEGKEPRLQ